MKAARDTKGINSTIHPHRIKPMNRTIAPDTRASALAITQGVSAYCGSFLEAFATTVPVTEDTTATGFGMLVERPV